MNKKNILSHKRILVCDTSLLGHRFEYDYRIIKELKINGFEVTFIVGEGEDEQFNRIRSLGVNIIKVEKLNSNIGLIKYIFKIRKESKFNYSKIMVLYFDSLVKYGFLFMKLNVPIIATQHWIFNNEIKFNIIKLLMINNNFKLIVHENFIKESIIKKGLNKDKIEVINYPINNEEYIEIGKKESLGKIGVNFDESSFYILAFGGTRYDKGLDLLIKAINDVKYNVKLIIAGKEQDIKREYIENIFNPTNRKSEIIYNLNFIKLENIKYYFNAVDCVAIPYRKSFLGQSGPLTEAIKFKKPVVAPRWQVIGETVDSFKAGELFDPENIEDMSKAIERIIENYNEYKDNLLNNRDNFICTRISKAFTNKYLMEVNR